MSKNIASRPMPTPRQWLFIAAGALAGSVIGFGLLEGGTLGGGIFAVCVFIGAIPYKKAIEAKK
ncbi:MAG: hypothetical protein KDD98_08435 [Sphingomonadaceae bacterium]|nr:hypothetical protein [Sphingomonadaceae bacterium]